MNYAGEQIIAALKAARRDKGLTQRALSEQAGMPQSHVSKIEQGEVDLQLSSLIELARALDLEVVTVPRKLIPAVQTIVRSGESSASRKAEHRRELLKALKRIRKSVTRLEAMPGDKAYLRQIEKAAAELENFQIGANDLKTIQSVALSLMNMPPEPSSIGDIKVIANRLRNLRNELAHRISEPVEEVRPAYTLDEDEDA